MLTEEERGEHFETCRRMMRDVLQDISVPQMALMLETWAPRVLDRHDARLVDLVRDAVCWPAIEADLKWMMWDPDAKMAEPAKALLAELDTLRAPT